MGYNTPTVLIGAFAVFFVLSLGVILVLWIALPLTVFSIKDLLRKCLKELKKTRKVLKTIAETQRPGSNEEANETDE